jgi:hypothetical protein
LNTVARASREHVSDTFERILTLLILPEAEAPWERDDTEED